MKNLFRPLNNLSLFALTKETINGIYTKELTRTYTTSGLKGKNAGMSIDGTNFYTYGYDTYGRLNKITTASGDFTYSRVVNGNVSTFEYVNNALGNRTSMKRSGSSFATSSTLNYTYDSRSEVIGAVSTAIPAYNFNYAYDPIGNRLTSTQEGENFTYTSNALNQYTTINTEHPTYDADGNMLTRDGWTQVWNGENRLIATFKSNQRLEFDYDGYKLVQELDALNNNALLRRYVWQPELVGLDVPLSIFDAAANQTYYYNTDANKNIRDLTASNGTIAAHYEYTPFGSQVVATGSYPANPFCFSSEYFDTETNLVYYNYRYYSQEMGRWLSRDPIAEKGGINLYLTVDNDVINVWDGLGLRSFMDYWTAPANWALTGEWFPSEEELGAAYEGFVEGISCWTECVITTHKCVAGMLLTFTEVIISPGVLTARYPKFRVVSPKQPWSSIPRLLGRAINLGPVDAYGRKLSESIGRNIGRSTTLIGAKIAFVGTLLAEAGVSIHCGIKCK